MRSNTFLISGGPLLQQGCTPGSVSGDRRWLRCQDLSGQRKHNKPNVAGSVRSGPTQWQCGKASRTGHGMGWRQRQEVQGRKVWDSSWKSILSDQPATTATVSPEQTVCQATSVRSASQAAPEWVPGSRDQGKDSRPRGSLGKWKMTQVRGRGSRGQGEKAANPGGVTEPATYRRLRLYPQDWRGNM